MSESVVGSDDLSESSHAPTGADLIQRQLMPLARRVLADHGVWALGTLWEMLRSQYSGQVKHLVLLTPIKYRGSFRNPRGAETPFVQVNVCLSWYALCWH